MWTYSIFSSNSVTIAQSYFAKTLTASAISTKDSIKCFLNTFIKILIKINAKSLCFSSARYQRVQNLVRDFRYALLIEICSLKLSSFERILQIFKHFSVISRVGKLWKQESKKSIKSWFFIIFLKKFIIFQPIFLLYSNQGNNLDYFLSNQVFI